MFPAPVNPTAAVPIAVGAASVQATLPVGSPGSSYYMICSNVGLWFAQGVNPTAVKGTAGSAFLPPNFPQVLDLRFGPKVAVIQDAAVGNASITPVAL